MNTWYLYFLLSAILFCVLSITNVVFGRKIGAKKIALYRQLTLTIVWSPIIIGLLWKTELLEKHAVMLVLCGIFWAWYLTVAFHAMNLTSIWISRIFVAVSRTITWFLIGFFFFQESISLYDLGWIIIMFTWFYLLARFRGEHFSKADILWVWVSLLAGVLFSINVLIFKIFAADFSALEAGYLLESTSLVFLALIMLFTSKESIKKSFSIEYKKLAILFCGAPLLLLASYGLAKSVDQIPFYVFNTMFILMLIISMILSWIFLKEKFTLKQLFAMWIIISGCVVVILL